VHPLVKEKPGRKPFRDIRAMREDPATIDAQSEAIRTRYTKIFGV
jgi:iron(III) transport system substrate-binding protein